MNKNQPLIFGDPPEKSDPTRSVKTALWAGARNKCPQCHEGRIFENYTKTHENCSSCGLYLAGHRADDAPPYFTTLIAGHLTIPLLMEMQFRLAPPLWFVFGFWGGILALLVWRLLPITKGALIGLQWANRMHGFSDRPEEDIEASLRS